LQKYELAIAGRKTKGKSKDLPLSNEPNRFGRYWSGLFAIVAAALLLARMTPD
jgi:hypothetical protein